MCENLYDTVYLSRKGSDFINLLREYVDDTVPGELAVAEPASILSDQFIGELVATHHPAPLNDRLQRLRNIRIFSNEGRSVFSYRSPDFYRNDLMPLADSSIIVRLPCNTYIPCNTYVPMGTFHIERGWEGLEGLPMTMEGMPMMPMNRTMIFRTWRRCLRYVSTRIIQKGGLKQGVCSRRNMYCLLASRLVCITSISLLQIR